MTNKQIAEAMGVSVRWVQALWARYRRQRGRPSGIRFPLPMGRPPAGLPGRREHGAVVGLHSRRRGGAARMERYIERNTGIHIPHRTIHEILAVNGLVQRSKRQIRRKAWIRWECSHSNMMWHTDFKLLPDGRRLVGYQDDASRRVMAYGVFDEATTENALAVLKAGMARYGRPASIMTDHGSQFFANEARGRRRGEAAFEAALKDWGIRHVKARVRHPQTNGKIERFHKEIELHLASFEAEASRTATRCDLPGGHFTVGGPFHADGPREPIDLLVHWYNNDRDHMSLDEGETPAMAYARKMPPRGVTVVDEQSGISYRRD